MAENTDRKFTLSHRMLVAAIAAIVIVFSVAAGLFSRASFAAQKSSSNTIEPGGPVSGVPGGIPGGVAGGVPGGVTGGVPGGIPGGIPGEEGQRNQLPPPPPPPLRKLSKPVLESLEQAPEIAAQFINRDNTPLTITSVRVKSVKVSAFSTDEKVTESYQVIKPIVSMVNNTDRQITGFKMRFRNKESKFHIVTYRSRLQIEPGETFTLGGSADDALFYMHESGNLDYLTAEITGVIFEDKGLWGDYPPPPPPAPPRGESSDVLVVPLEPPNRGEPREDPPASSSDAPDGNKIVRKSGGVLMNSAIKRVNPVYSPLAKAANVSGAVSVEITIDERGIVSSARAVSGHPLLKAAAVEAARQWEFPPTTLSGEPVRVIGTITFNFQP